MPTACLEKFDSRTTTDGQSLELVYNVTGTADQDAAIFTLKGVAPATVGSLVRQPVTVEPVCVDLLNPDKSLWTGTVRYAPYEKPQPPQTGESSYSFDTGGGTQHITQSLQTIGRYAPPGKTAPDFKGAIGVTHDSVEGVDITVPVFNFSEMHYIANGYVDNAYKYTLFLLTGTTNNAAFRGFAAGECLFLGASGSKRGAWGDWEITFRFAASPNQTNFYVGDILVPAKKGWEYMWVRYADEEDETAKAIVKRPVAVYIEKVYESGNYANLGIGA